MLEVGCGAANILQHHEELQSRYTGCDFSETLIKENSSKYPLANFDVIKTANQLPYSDETFDLVFSVYVIEHTTNPPGFLNECLRVLKKGGTLIILCPDFLGQGRMSSQRAGYSTGTTQDKLNKGKWFDALVTYFDNRLKIPLYCQYLLFKIRNTPRFYINILPTVFSDDFNPDVDAVYVTSRKELVTFLKTRTVEVSNSLELKEYEKRRKLIYLKLKKNN
jgi:ubiquinone/menaquinone biosynthesis C-methylase UbiE